VVSGLVALEDERDTAQLDSIAVMQTRALREHAVDPATDSRVHIVVHPFIRGWVPSNHTVFRLEAGEPHVLGLRAADGDDVADKSEPLLDAGRLRATDGSMAVRGDDETGISGPYRRTVLGGTEVR
jgi:hypothetical protein